RAWGEGSEVAGRATTPDTPAWGRAARGRRPSAPPPPAARSRGRGGGGWGGDRKQYRTPLMPRIEIVPSILSADVGRLAEQVKEAEAAGADRIQVDVMDGHFVPNLTFGPGVVEAVRRATKLPIEAHLMVDRPELFLEAFAKSGATLIEVQVEATSSLYRTVQTIKELGAKAGVAINPATPVEDLREILPYIDLVNVMTVEPGFGGQKFI